MATMAILGAGMMGSAMSVPARDRGHTVRIVGTHLDRDIIDRLRADNIHPQMKRRLPDGISFYQTEAVDEALDGVDLVVCGVSSFGVDWFGETMLPRLPEGVPLLCITKGLDLAEDGTLHTFPARFEDMLLPGQTRAINAVGGPCTSYELADRHQSQVAFCGRDPQCLAWLRDLLATPYYHINLSTDVTGVEVAVALKNAYALGVTLAVGMARCTEGPDGAQHYNTEAALFGQSVREMGRLLALLGGGAENIVYGAGDLYVTIFGGRTRLLGTLLGQGYSFEKAMEALDGVTLESVAITRRIAQAIRLMARQGTACLDDYPLLLHVSDIIERGAPVNIPWEAFTTRS